MPQIHYYEEGEGPPIVLLHGFCESNTFWHTLSHELASQFRVICPDLPGFGKSPMSIQGFTLEKISDILVEWIKDLGIQKCVVIGHSLGGYISLEILRKYPNFVNGIGLLNSSAFEDSADKKANRNKLIDFIKKNNVAPFLSTFVPSLFYPNTIANHQNIIDQLRTEGKSIASKSVINYAAAMRDRVDSIDLITQHPDRILLISGEFDQNVPLETSRKMAGFLNEQNVHIVPESAHMSLFEQSEICYTAIERFVKSVSED